MNLVQICCLIQILVVVNGESFENTLQYIEKELENLQEDKKLGPVEKYFKMVVLKNTLDQIIENREQALRKIQNQEIERKLKEEKETEERSRLESQVFEKYLAKDMGKSSFYRDFHTMRY